MNLHSFFGQVPTLRMQDPLARLLGGADNGILEYSYADAVKLAGHSCPTVAAAYWLTTTVRNVFSLMSARRSVGWMD